MTSLSIKATRVTEVDDGEYSFEVHSVFAISALGFLMMYFPYFVSIMLPLSALWYEIILRTSRIIQESHLTVERNLNNNKNTP